jgi:hypothetical protein
MNVNILSEFVNIIGKEKLFISIDVQNGYIHLNFTELQKKMAV